MNAAAVGQVIYETKKTDEKRNTANHGGFQPIFTASYPLNCLTWHQPKLVLSWLKWDVIVGISSWGAKLPSGVGTLVITATGEKANCVCGDLV